MEKYYHFDRFKTLEELDGENWGTPNFDSKLVITFHNLRKKKLNDFNIEDLRIMIGQNFSLQYLVPLALEILEDNLFAIGDFYEGDLLQSVLNINNGFWMKNYQLKTDFEGILEKGYIGFTKKIK